MALRLIYGKSGSGKTSFCINEAVAKDSKAIIIVPEQYSFTAEQMLAEKLGVFGMGGAQIQSFARLAEREMKTSDGAALPHIDKGGKAIILHKIIKDNAKDLVLLGENEGDGASQMLSLISELKRYNIRKEDLDGLCDKINDPRLKLKLNETALIYREFEKKIKDRFVNSDDNLARLSKALCGSQSVADTHFYIDGFSSFTESELAVIAVLMKKASSVSVTLCMDKSERGRLEFMPSEKTEKTLIRMAQEKSVEILEGVSLLSKPRENAELSHLLREYFSYPHTEYSGKAQDIELFEAKNPYSEVCFVASGIINLCREKKYKFRDIGIVCGDMQTYSKYIKTVFPRFGISVFPDRKIGILNHPIVTFLLSALEIITSGYTYESVFRYAKSGFLPVNADMTDALENYVLATGIRGDVWKKDEKWTYRSEIFAQREEMSDEEKLSLEEINSARLQIIAPLVRLDKSLCSSRKVSDKCRAVYDFITYMHLDEKAEEIAKAFEKSGDGYRAVEYRSVFNKVIDALDDMSDSIGDDSVSNKTFFEILKSGLSQYEIGLIPALKDGVLCGDIARIKGYDVKALFIVGASDSQFPSLPSHNGFLGDADRDFLSSHGVTLAPSTLAQALEGEHLVYKALSSPSEKLFLSFPAEGFDGASLRPAAIISRIMEIFPSLELKSDILETEDGLALSSPYSAFDFLVKKFSSNEPLNENYAAAYNFFSQSPYWSDKLEKAIASLNYKNTTVPLSAETVSSLMGNTLRTAVSRLESFSRCPFSYFMNYTLGAQERKILKVTTADAGNFLHNFIDEFSRRLEKNEKNWADVDSAYIREETEAIFSSFDKRLNRFVLDSSPRAARLFSRLTQTVYASIMFIKEHITRGKFVPLGYEVSFDENGRFKPVNITLPNGAKVVLRGRIDRIDALNTDGKTFVRVIDYKSGNKEFDIRDVFYGINLQLAVYISALCQNEGMHPAGILYFKLGNPVTKAEPGMSEEAIFADKLAGLKLNGLLVNDASLLQDMDSEKETYDFLPFKPLKSGGFRGSLATADDFAAMQRYVESTVKKIASGILGGDTSVYPCGTTEEDSPCRYCAYKSACAFDSSAGNCYRDKIKLGSDECWEVIRGEN